MKHRRRRSRRSGPTLRGASQLQFELLETRCLLSVEPSTGVFIESGQDLSNTFYDALAVGDFNNDNIDDLFAITNDQMARVLLSDSNGHFSDTGQRFSIVSQQGSGNAKGLVADFDKDGDQDIVIVESRAIAVLTNDGTGHFTELVRYSNATAQFDGDLGDFDDDGDIDLIIGGATNTIWLNSGTAQFVAQQPFTADDNTAGIEVGDIDGDDDLDLLLIPYSGTATFWLNDSGAVFSKSDATISSARRGGVLDDFDGDGDVDAVVMSRNRDLLWLNDGEGNFSSVTSGVAEGLAIEAIDLEGDGDLDLIVGMSAGSTSRSRSNLVFVNPGNGSFVRQNADFGLGTAKAVAVGDFDGDRDHDIAIADNRDERLTIYLNSDADLMVQVSPTSTTVSAGTSETINYDLTVINNGPRDVPLANVIDQFSGALSDVSISELTLVGNATSTLSTGNLTGALVDTVSLPAGASITYRIAATLTVPLSDETIETHVASIVGPADLLEASLANNKARGVNQLPTTRPSSTAIFVDTGQGLLTYGGASALGDLDGDGDNDAIIAVDTNQDRNGLNVLLNDGAGNFAISAKFGIYEFDDIVLGDIDSDGDLDAIALDKNGLSQIWLNDGQAQFTLFNGAIFDSARHLGLGDLDNDGDLDAFVVRGATTLGVSNQVYLNDGSGRFVDTGQALGFSDSEYVDLHDLDGDGDLDAVVGNRYRTLANRIWINDGDGQFADAGISLGNGFTHTIIAADFTGDGIPDILEGNQGGPSVLWVLQNNAYVARPLPSSTDEDFDMEVGDLDGDGDLDVLMAGSDRVLLNNGAGVFTTSNRQSFNTSFFGADLADLDGDGDLDAYFVSAQGSRDQIWLNGDVDLQLRFEAAPAGSTVEPGQVLDYELVVENTGPNPVTDAQLTIQMPVPFAGASIDAVILSSGAASSLVPHPGATGSLVIDTVNLAVGATIRYQLKATISADVEDFQSPNSTAALTATVDTGTGNLLDANSIDNAITDSNLVSLTTSLGTGVLVDTGQQFDGISSTDVVLGDLDGDGDLDAVTSSDDPGAANRLWINDGNGNFADSGQMLGDFNSLSVALGDVDGDSDLDVLIGNFDNADHGSSLLLNDGTGQLTPSDRGLVTRGARKVTLADLNGDGAPDATVDGDIFLNDGAGYFTATGNQLLADRTYTPAYGDVDADGDLDVLYSNRIEINRGDGQFEPVVIQLGAATPRTSSFVDVDRDADLDVILLYEGASDIVLLNDGSGNFSDTGLRIDNEYSDKVIAGDIDGDGDLDLLVFGYERFNKERPTLYLNDGAGNFSPNGQRLAAFAGLGDGALGDLDGDGDLDAFVVNDSGPSSVWLNPAMQQLVDLAVEKSAGQVTVRQGERLTYTITVTNHGPNEAVGATVTDSLPTQLANAELLSVTTTGAAVSIANTGSLSGELLDTIDVPVGATITYEITGTVLGPSAAHQPTQYWLSNTVEVVVPESMIDPFTANNRAVDADIVTLFASGGSGIFENSGQLFTAADAQDVRLGDLDGDGDLDAVVVYDGAPDELWINDGLGEFSKVSGWISQSNNRSTSVVLGDVNGDGSLDVAIFDTGDRLHFWLNDGFGGFSSGGFVHFSSDPAPDFTSLIDIDGDGDLEAKSASQFFFNDGSGSFFNGDFLSDSVSSLAFGDIDADGDLDALGVNYRLENDGTGLLRRIGERFTNTSSPWTLGDLDGDGDLDAIRGTFSTHGIWINDGGTFTQQADLPGSPGADQTLLADADGDSDLDIFVLERDNNLRVWINQGDATFVDPGLRFGSQFADRFALGDLNGDGTVDAFVVGNGIPGTVWFNQQIDQPVDLSIEISNSATMAEAGDTLTYTVTARNLSATAAPGAIVTANFVPTAAAIRLIGVAAEGGAQTTISTGNIVGTFSDAVDLPGGASITYTLEVDLAPPGLADAVASFEVTAIANIAVPEALGDDIAPGNNTDADINLIFPAAHKGLAQFATVQVIDQPPSIEKVALGDVDGDGDLDAALSNGRILINQGAGTFVDSNQQLEFQKNLNPPTVHLLDIDADGDLDLYIRERLFLNDGNGTFIRVEDFSSYLPDNRAEFGDVDGDGDQDAVVSGRVFINTGGQFEFLGQQVSANRSFRLGDLDGDGDLDVFARDGGNAGFVWLNEGNGDFVSTGQILYDGNTTNFELGDLDGDGDLDAWIVRIGSDDSNRVWFNDGTGTFTEGLQAIPNSSARDVTLADVDADGDLDAIVAASGVYAPQSIFLNDGHGNFEIADTVSNPREIATVAAGDLDGDGDVDALFAGYYHVVVALNGDVDLAIDIDSAPTEVAAGDIVPYTITVSNNGPIAVQGALVELFADLPIADLQILDVQLAGGATSLDLMVDVPAGSITGLIDLPVGGSIVYTTQATVGEQPAPSSDENSFFSVRAAITPPEGLFDAVTVNNVAVNEKRLRLTSAIPTGAFIDSHQELGDDDTNDIVLGDIDGDGDLDALTADATGIHLWVNENGQFGSPRQVAAGESGAVALADFDGDSHLDLIFSPLRFSRQVWLNDGAGNFADTGQRFGSGGTDDIQIVDIDGDGDLDIPAGYQYGKLNVFLNDGAGTFSATVSMGSFGSSRHALGDLDNDGDIDLLTNHNSYLVNNGDLTFTEFDFTEPVGAANAVSLADLDGDGDLDVFIVGSNGNRVALNDGTGNMIDSGQQLGFLASRDVALADLDGDGDIDAFVTNENGPDQVWRNDSAGNFSYFGPTLGSDMGRSVALGDIDGDGLVDAFVANFEAPNRVWLGIDIREVPDLRIEKSAGQVAVELGSRLTYTIEVSNTGVVPVEGANVVDIFDARLVDILLDSLEVVGGAVSGLTPGPLTEGLVDSVDLPLGAKITYTVSAIVSDDPSSFAPRSIVTNSARINVPETFLFDLTPRDNVTTDSDIVLLPNTRGTGFFNGSVAGVYNSLTFDVVFGDVDGDGDLDAALARGPDTSDNPDNGNLIWLNDGTGRFVDSGQKLGSSRTISLRFGDIDNDGDLDLIAGNTGGMRVWENDGTGQFAARNEEYRSVSISELEFGDLDGDGSLDVYAAVDGRDIVWLNDGAGTFSQGFLTGFKDTNGVELGDLDGDGDLDAILATFREESVVLFNDGQGRFLESSTPLTDDGLGPVTLGDVDGDGDLDALLRVRFTPPGGSEVNRTEVLLNDGNGNFVATVSPINTFSAQDHFLVDLDADGDLDLAVGEDLYNNNSGDLVWLNDGSGVFTRGNTRVTGTRSTGLAVGDIDGDGDPDLLFTYTDNRAPVKWINANRVDVAVDIEVESTSASLGSPLRYKVQLTNNGTFPASNIQLVSPWGRQLAQTSVTGIEVDGIANGSIAIGPFSGNFVSTVDLDPGASITYTIDGIVSTTLSENTATAGSLELLAQANIPVDQSDTLPADNTASRILVVDLASDAGHGSFVDSTQQLGTGISTDIAYADLDGDGDLDGFVTRRLATNLVLENQGNGVFLDKELALGVADSFAVALGNLDTDSDIDAVIANRNQGIQVLINFPGRFLSGASLGPKLDYRDVALADLTGDGRLDLVAASHGPNLIWRGSVSASFNALAGDLGEGASSAVAVGDVDGDGDIDILFANANNEANQLWLNEGSGTFINSERNVGFGDSTDAAFADLDSDGDLDLLLTNRNTGNEIWLNNGNGNFTRAPQILGNDRSVNVALGDIDGDGDVDVVIANEAGRGNRIWLNNGFASFVDAGISIGSSSTNAIVLGDADNDGDFDLLVANSFGPGNEFWRNQLSVDNPNADFNGNGMVDAADYTVWRDHLGHFVEIAGTNGDADGNGVVDVRDYEIWRATFGTMIVSTATLDAHADAANLLSAASDAQSNTTSGTSQPAVTSTREEHVGTSIGKSLQVTIPSTTAKFSTRRNEQQTGNTLSDARRYKEFNQLLLAARRHGEQNRHEQTKSSMDLGEKFSREDQDNPFADKDAAFSDWNETLSRLLIWKRMLSVDGKAF